MISALRINKLLNAFGLSILIGGITLFLTGFHNLDLAVNMILMAIREDPDIFFNYCDRNIAGKCSVYDEIYYSGAKMIHLSNSLIVGGSGLYFWTLGEILQDSGDHKKRV